MVFITTKNHDLGEFDVFFPNSLVVCFSYSSLSNWVNDFFSAKSHRLGNII